MKLDEVGYFLKPARKKNDADHLRLNSLITHLGEKGTEKETQLRIPLQVIIHDRLLIVNSPFAGRYQYFLQVAFSSYESGLFHQRHFNFQTENDTNFD